MRLLLDTQVILWAANGQRRPGKAARQALTQSEDIYVSAISFAEIAIKVSIGKLEMPENLNAVLHNYDARALHLTPEHGLRVESLPLHHRDPYDRLLVAQALEEGLSILTSDSRFSDYDVDVIPAV